MGTAILGFILGLIFGFLFSHLFWFLVKYQKGCCGPVGYIILACLCLLGVILGIVALADHAIIWELWPEYIFVDILEMVSMIPSIYQAILLITLFQRENAQAQEGTVVVKDDEVEDNKAVNEHGQEDEELEAQDPHHAEAVEASQVDALALAAELLGPGAAPQERVEETQRRIVDGRGRESGGPRVMAVGRAPGPGLHLRQPEAEAREAVGPLDGVDVGAVVHGARAEGPLQLLLEEQADIL